MCSGNCQNGLRELLGSHVCLEVSEDSFPGIYSMTNRALHPNHRMLSTVDCQSGWGPTSWSMHKRERNAKQPWLPLGHKLRVQTFLQKYHLLHCRRDKVILLLFPDKPENYPSAITTKWDCLNSKCENQQQQWGLKDRQQGSSSVLSPRMESMGGQGGEGCMGPLSLPPKCQNYRHPPPHLIWVLLSKQRTICIGSMSGLGSLTHPLGLGSLTYHLALYRSILLSPGLTYTD